MATARKTKGNIDTTLANLSKEGVEALSRIWAKNDEDTLKMGREVKHQAAAEAAAKNKPKTTTRKKGK